MSAETVANFIIFGLFCWIIFGAVVGTIICREVRRIGREDSEQ